MLLNPRYVGRFRDVASVLVRHGFADVLAVLDLQRFLPGRDHVATSPAEKLHQRAKGLRLAFEELGATYIKLGQILSTRPDLLPAAYLEELAQLQDRVPPFAFAAVRHAIEEEQQLPMDRVFTRFDEVPAASASLSQVHRADLAPGAAPGALSREVAVKVLRPGVEREVELDLEILAEVASFASRSALGRKLELESVVEQLSRTLTDELDLTREARNAQHFRAAVAGYERLRVPEVVVELCTRRVYVAEYVHGSRLPERASPPLKEAADELWRAYLDQILVGGLFQCDPHPGNFLLDPEGRIVLLDHGMVAYLSRQNQLLLLSLLLGLAEADGERVADACAEIGLPGGEFRERAFKSEIGVLVARSSGLPLGQLAIGRLFLDVSRTAFRNDILIPPDMLLLGKTLLGLEGVCRRLDPAMDPVLTMREMASPLLRRQLSREASPHRALGATLEARSLLTQVPASVRRILSRAASNDLRFGFKLDGAEEFQAAMEKIASRITLGLITAALIIGSAVLLNVRAGIMVGGYPLFALIGFLLAAGLGIYLVVKIIVVDRY